LIHTIYIQNARYEEKMGKNKKTRENNMLKIRLLESKGKVTTLTHNQVVPGSSPGGPTF